MKKLSLEEFKKSVGDQSKELDGLTGGILGDCHCLVVFEPGGGCPNPPIKNPDPIARICNPCFSTTSHLFFSYT